MCVALGSIKDLKYAGRSINCCYVGGGSKPYNACKAQLVDIRASPYMLCQLVAVVALGRWVIGYRDT